MDNWRLKSMTRFYYKRNLDRTLWLRV
jgi:hypothetical protein